MANHGELCRPHAKRRRAVCRHLRQLAPTFHPVCCRLCFNMLQVLLLARYVAEKAWRRRETRCGVLESCAWAN